MRAFVKRGGAVAIVAILVYGAYTYGLNIGSQERSVKITDSKQLINADFNAD